MKPQTSSHGILLSGREGLACVGALALVSLLLPAFWDRAERGFWGDGSRLPQKFSEDYRLFSTACRQALAEGKTLCLGDSVIWGQYVGPDQALPQDLNRLLGQNRFANLGLDGAHPAALAGLIHRQASYLRGARVLLQLDPLWMSSLQRDLSAREPQDFNHSQLVPQFWGKPPCYREQVSRRIGIVVDRGGGPRAWVRHLQLSCFGGQDLPAWTLDHPYENPFYALKPLTALESPSPETEARPWTERGITPQNFPWVPLETSLQWRFFKQGLEELLENKNQVLVLLGPFNEALLTEESHERYRGLEAGMEAWLRERGVSFLAPKPLNSALYADASHPLAPGYEILAKELLTLPFLERYNKEIPNE